MLRADQIDAAADGIIAAALTGDGWKEALAAFARAAGARDAVLMCNAADRMVAAVVTDEAAEAVAQFAAGNAPPNSRYTRVRSDFIHGFRVDHDDYTDEDLARDPFYQEFLRANGLFWHANLRMTPARDEYVELSLKRSIRLGPYQRSDVAVMNGVVPKIRFASRIAKQTLDAEARGMTSMLHRRGDLVVELDTEGRVISDDAILAGDPRIPLRVLGRRLRTVDPLARQSVENAVARALPPERHISLVLLSDSDGRRYYLQIHPVPGRARDVFRSAAALAVLICGEPGLPTLRFDPSIIREAFDLTDREADVAGLLAEGLGLAAIARRLNIGAGTVRTYLKGAFEKTATRRQAELVALIARLAA